MAGSGLDRSPVHDAREIEGSLARWHGGGGGRGVDRRRDFLGRGRHRLVVEERGPCRQLFGGSCRFDRGLRGPRGGAGAGRSGRMEPASSAPATVEVTIMGGRGTSATVDGTDNGGRITS